MRSRASLALVVALAWAVPASSQTPMRIALVPLDDRPVSLQYPRLMAPLADAVLVTPPPSMLGRFTTPGETAAIAGWLASLDVAGLDAVIVSVDMLAYGGLVASRRHAVDAAVALARLQVLRDLRRRRPDLPIFGFSVIMRLAPTADGSNEAWRTALARWAEIAPERDAPATAIEVDRLERGIPQAALTDYQAARARNLQVNHASLDLLDTGVFTHLVLSQDDAKPRGVHVADRESLARAISARRLTGRVGIQPGADEVAMLLLSRAVLAHQAQRPTIHAVYSSEAARTMVAPFEDRPLHETVRFQIDTAGAVPTASPDADLTLFVFASRHQPGMSAPFVERIASAVDAGRRVVVADIDPRGDVQGASVPFTDAILARGVVPRLYGYASWNTAGNTLGTAIPHGLLHHAGLTRALRCRSDGLATIAEAQIRFLLHRLVNDYGYQGIVRPDVNGVLRASGRASMSLDAGGAVVADESLARLAPIVTRLTARFTERPLRLGAVHEAVVEARVDAVRPLTLSLPWARTFEALVGLDVSLTVRDIGPDRPRCKAAAP